MNNNIFKQCWFWLMMIFVVLLLGLILSLCAIFPTSHKMFASGEFWTAVGSLATVVTLAITVGIFYSEKRRDRIRATLTEFPSIRDKNYELFLKISRMSKKGRKRRLKKYLSEMERFAVGVNENAYDIKIINRMSGGMLISQYKKYTKPFIDEQRTKNKSNFIKSENLYSEYEKMIYELYKLRKIC